MTNPPCPKCKSLSIARTQRRRLLQSFILQRLGFYPWVCSDCRQHFSLKFRSKVKRRRRDVGEIYLPPVG